MSHTCFNATSVMPIIHTAVDFAIEEHKTHAKSLPTIDYARENGIVIIVSLPPHTSHKLQPLDRSFF